MKSILLCIYILVGPVVVLLTTMAISEKLFPSLFHNSVQDRISNAIQLHFEKQPDVPIALFHKDIILTTKDISKGKKLDVESLERYYYSGKNEDSKKVVHQNQQVLGAIAKKSISKGQLLFADDLEKGAKVEHPGRVDREIRLSDHKETLDIFVLSIVIVASCFLFASYIWVAVIAFKKSLPWGLSCLMLPLAASIFEMKNWELTKKPFHLKLLSFIFLGIYLGGALSGLLVSNQIDDQLATSTKVHKGEP